MKTLTVRTDSPEQTRELGERLGGLLRPGDVAALAGGLGAGKTVFVSGLARGLGVEDERLVTSPTFVILHEYPGRISLYHFDLYRLERIQDVWDLGYEEYFEGRGVCAVEWAEKFPELFGPATLWVGLARTGETTRTIEFRPGEGFTSRWERMTEVLASGLQA